MTNLTGKFSRGTVKYSILDEPSFTYACHCRLCQRYTASAFVVHSPIEMSNFSLDQGDLVTTPGPSGSSGGYFIKRCKNCSDQIYSHFFGNSKVAVLKTTTLDEANRFPPQAHIYVKNKLSWIELGDRIPQFGEFYDFEKIYSPASLSRRKKLG